VRQQELEQQQERQRQQQERQQQVQQQELQQQVQVLLFCHKRPKQRPTKLPRGVIFSWGISFNRYKKRFKGCHIPNKSDV
jgi:hypothetical protein